MIRKYRIKERGRRRPEDIENEIQVENELKEIPKPKYWNVLPVQIIQLLIFLVTKGPSSLKAYLAALKEDRKRAEEERVREEEQAKRAKEDEERKRERRAQMKQRKKVTHIPDYTGRETNSTKSAVTAPCVEPDIPVIIGGPWTDEEFIELGRLMAKFPGGTPGRWERIAEQMSRTVYEVTKMSSKALDRLALRAQEIQNENVEIRVRYVLTKFCFCFAL